MVQSPKGEQSTINFMTGYVNATNREVKATLEGDAWTVTVEERRGPRSAAGGHYRRLTAAYVLPAAAGQWRNHQIRAYDRTIGPVQR